MDMFQSHSGLFAVAFKVWIETSQSAQIVTQVVCSEAEGGTETRFRVISPSGDWLASVWRTEMDSKMDMAFWTCCSAHGNEICRGE